MKANPICREGKALKIWRRSAWLIIGVALLASAWPVAAQTFRGSIVGTVTDQSQAAVPGAKVTVKNEGTGQSRSTVTDETGGFNIPELPIGSYSITFEFQGLQTVTQTGVRVNVAAERRVDVQMVPGKLEQSVEVHAEIPQVATTEDTLGGTLVATQVENLPVNGRDYTKLIFLNPGVSGSPDQITDSPGSFAVFSMNGARGRSVNFLLDGTDMNDGYRNDPAINEAGVFGTPATILPVDAVAELAVLSNFEPEYGRGAGAVVNIVTKSGTNQFHGSAAEYFRNSALDARNFFNDVQSSSGLIPPKASFHNNQYGGSLGGPIVKDKTFFYADYEGQQETVGVVTLGCVPSAGDIATATTNIGGAAFINPVISKLLARNPWPSSTVSSANCPNATVTSPSFNRLTSVIGKVDHTINTDNMITGRYFFGDSVQSFPLALTASGGQLPGFNTYTPTRVQLVSVSYVHTFGATQVNELRFGWNRFGEGFFPADRSFHPSSIGLCAASTTADCSGSGFADSGLPIILVSGVSQLGSTGSLPRHRVDSNTQLIDDFSWKIDRHELKFGAEFHRTTIDQYFGKYFRGRMKFSSLEDFLTGTVDGGFQYSGNSNRNTFENSFGLYFQDGYRVDSRLTVNYGVRWDYFGVVGEKNNLLSNITSMSPAAGTGTFTLTQVGKSGLSSLYHPDYKNFAPRVNAAWDVTGKGKTVVRAGFGIFFDGFSQDMVIGHLPYAPYFDPGPAYNPLPGANPIFSAGVTGSIANGVPVFGDETACNYECDAFGFDRNIKTPYMLNYNLNIQQQLTNNVVLQVGYVGSQGHRLWRFFDLAQPSAAAINAADQACDCITDYSGDARPLNGNPYGSFYVLNENSTGRSNYNGLQTSLRITGWHGISSMLNYVWSRSMDNSSDGEDFEPNAAQPNDSTQPALEYGPSNFNLPHRLTWIFGYDIPRMEGNRKRLKNGWGFNSTLTMQSGQPFHLNYNFWDDFSGSGNGFDRPDVVGPTVYHSDPLHFLDLGSFAIPCTVTAATGAASDCVIGTRHYGNMGRNSLVGPNFKQWDFALYKNTPINERLTVQFRADFFNIVNHPNFANPYLPAFIADAAFNGFTQSGNREVGAGSLPITATGDVGVGNPFLGGGGPRGIQLAVKFSF